MRDPCWMPSAASRALPRARDQRGVARAAALQAADAVPRLAPRVQRPARRRTLPATASRSPTRRSTRCRSCASAGSPGRSREEMGVAREGLELGGWGGLGTMPSRPNARSRASGVAGRRAIPRSIASGSVHGTDAVTGLASRGPRAADRSRVAAAPRPFPRVARRLPHPLISKSVRCSILSLHRDSWTSPRGWISRACASGQSSGHALAGETTESHFLAGPPFDAEGHHLARWRPDALARSANEARTLLLPGEMGQRSKAMA